MQQKELGLPIDPLLEQDQELQQAIIALRETAPELWQSEQNIWREAEHSRTLGFKNYLLTVVYDLLILGNSQAKILDWKTYLQPENPHKLAQNWQTRLYLYVLAETTNYLPEQLSMTYWFVKLPTRPESLTFSYSQILHEKTRQDLNYLLTQLEQWLENYFNKGKDFPHFSSCQTSCPYYSAFESRFKPEKIILKSIDEIDEVPF